MSVKSSNAKGNTKSQGSVLWLLQVSEGRQGTSDLQCLSVCFLKQSMFSVNDVSSEIVTQYN